MRISGPYITKTVEVTYDVLDTDAYWHLDYYGAEDPDGGFLYAKVAFPNLRDAKAQHELEAHRTAQLRIKERSRSRKK